MSLIGHSQPLFPDVINLSKGATITVNATCGQSEPEAYCILAGDNRREPRCEICDAVSINDQNRHPIANAIDGTSSWWQSPSLQNGGRYEWVTITVDLKQVSDFFW